VGAWRKAPAVGALKYSTQTEIQKMQKSEVKKWLYWPEKGPAVGTSSQAYVDRD